MGNSARRFFGWLLLVVAGFIAFIFVVGLLGVLVQEGGDLAIVPFGTMVVVGFILTGVPYSLGRRLLRAPRQTAPAPDSPS